MVSVLTGGSFNTSADSCAKNGFDDGHNKTAETRNETRKKLFALENQMFYQTNICLLLA